MDNYMQGSKLVLHDGDAEDADITSDLALLPDTEALADRPKPCLAEVQELPRDWAKLFDGQLYSLGDCKSCTACTARSAYAAWIIQHC
jgi:hypothetical protein